MKFHPFFLYVPAILFAILIFTLSHIPNYLLPPTTFNLQDKLLHSFVFFLFGISLLIAFTRFKNKAKVIVLVLLLGSIYGLLDEVHQLFVPGRVCDITDWLSDTIGVSLSLLFRNKIKTFIENKYFARR